MKDYVGMMMLLIINNAPNNSLNRSGISLDVIVNLDASLNISRPVNSSVGPLRLMNLERDKNHGCLHNYLRMR
jgi:hypothetical protein